MTDLLKERARAAGLKYIITRSEALASGFFRKMGFHF